MGGFGGGFRGGFGGFRGGFNRGFNNFGFGRFGRFNNGFGGWGWGWPVGWWGGPWDSGWGGGWDGGYPYDAGYASPAYATAPAYAAPAYPSGGVNIVYAPQGPIYAAPVNPVIREYEYDQYGQPLGRPSGGSSGGGSGEASASPIYLIAFQNNHAIQAAVAYWVQGQTLHYVTLQHEEHQAPLSSLDRALTLQLNHDRNVPFQLP